MVDVEKVAHCDPIGGTGLEEPVGNRKRAVQCN
jgi:hypothetical protein